MGLILLRRKPRLPQNKRRYYISLVSLWIYALLWVVGVILVFYIWRPSAPLLILLLVAFMVAAPHPKELFRSFHSGTRRQPQTGKIINFHRTRDRETDLDYNWHRYYDPGIAA